MKSDMKFPRQILLATLAVGLLASYPMYLWADREVVVGVLTGGLISLVNVLIGYVSVEFAFNKSNATFLKVVLGGMGVRLSLIAVTLIVLIKVSSVHLYSLISSMLFFYFLYITFEILFINKKIALKNRP
ncbi:MAG: ATP synthase subunit I [Bacteroidota bacterium]